MLKIQRKHKLKNQIIGVVLAFSLLPFLIFSLQISKNYARIWNNKINEILESRIKQDNSTFQNLLSNMVYTSNLILTDDRLMEKFTLEQSLETSGNDYGQIISELSKVAMLYSEFDTNITILDFGENIYKTWIGRISDTNIRETMTDFRKQLKEKDRDILWYIGDTLSFNSYTNQHDPNLCMIRSVKEPQYGDKTGVLLINVSTKQIIEKMYKDVDDENEGYLIVDENQNIVIQTPLIARLLANDPAALELLLSSGGSQLISLDGALYNVVQTKFKNYDLNLKSYLVVFSDDLNEELKTLQMKFLVLSVVLSILAIVILFFIAKTISRPIDRLSKFMLRAQKENVFEKCEMNVGTYETDMLIKGYNALVDAIYNYADVIKQQEEEKGKINFMMLQSQINPHFLFNTLNTIKWMCYMNEHRKEGDLIASLGRMYEIVTNRGSEYISIADEIEFIKSYINLMTARMDTEIKVEFVCGNDLMEKRILKFLLQPFVENIFIYAFEGERDYPDKTIRIGICRENDKLAIAIIDNGKGFKENVLDRLNSQMKQNSNILSHIGIVNVAKRIQLYYGNEYGIRIESGRNGTQVTMTLPVLDEVDDDKGSDRG
jgi:two-component system sensor histidine kinase YesM